MFESFKTACPHCRSNDLAVVGATLVATGERLEMHSPLSIDGYEVEGAEDLKDASTEDETVRCMSCNHEFPLADITL